MGQEGRRQSHTTTAEVDHQLPAKHLGRAVRVTPTLSGPGASDGCACVPAPARGFTLGCVGVCLTPKHFHLTRSGKTTLLNHILTSNHGKRIAVVENEFGEIDIDGGLVAAKLAGDEDVLLLNNGCLCCSVRGDLVRMLTDLATTKRGRFDHVVIETTGLANPAPIIQTFYLEPELQEAYRLDGVVTLVDAKHCELHLADTRQEGVVNEALEQIAFADRLVINKTDLATASAVQALERRLRGINAMARMRRTQRGVVDLDYVLGVGGFDLERVTQDGFFTLQPKAPEPVAKAAEAHGHSHEQSHSHGSDAAECGEPVADGHSHSHSHSHGAVADDCQDVACSDPSHDHGHGHSHSHGAHTDAVSSVSLQLDGELDLDAVNDWLGDLLAQRWQDMYRMKGVLAIQGFDERYVIQGVHALFEGACDTPWRQGDRKANKLVFIGKELDEQELREGMRKCLAEGKVPGAAR